MARLSYRSNTLQCVACSAVVEEDHLYSFEGEPICDRCFATQQAPLPSLRPAAQHEPWTPWLSRRVAWLHALGPGGWGSLVAGALAMGSLAGSRRPWESALGPSVRAVVLLAVALWLLRGAVRRAGQRFAER